MRKFVLTAAVVAFAGLASAEAKSLSFEKVVFAQDTTKQDTTKKTPSQQTPAAEQSNPVNMEDLPEAVKTTLRADIFKEWIPSSAILVKSEDKEYYQVEVKKGEEVRAIRIGADGKVVQ